MTISVLVIGDQHFKVNNIPEVDEYMNKIEVIALNKNPDFIVLLGDLLDKHEKLHTLALNKACEFIDRMRNIAKTYVIVGNHDMCSNQVFLSSEHWLNSLKEWKDVTIVDDVIIEDYDEKEFLFAPYVFTGRFSEALNTLPDEKWKNVACIFCHQEFKGCKMGAIISEDGDEWSYDYPQIVSGHIHKNQSIGKNIYYPGSSMQVSYGETEQNVVSFLSFENLEDNNYILEEIIVDLPRKKIVYLDVYEAEKYENIKSRDKIKLSISGNYEEFKTFKKTKKFKELSNSGVQIVFKTNRKEIKSYNDKIESYISENEENSSDFHSILIDIIKKEKNPYLLETYELIINDKIIDPTDVIYI
jgi:DNA repair exonuclease SbcCD nuclease subunit